MQPLPGRLSDIDRQQRGVQSQYGPCKTVRFLERWEKTEKTTSFFCAIWHYGTQLSTVQKTQEAEWKHEECEEHSFFTLGDQPPPLSARQARCPDGNNVYRQLSLPQSAAGDSGDLEYLLERRAGDRLRDLEYRGMMIFRALLAARERRQAAGHRPPDKNRS